MNTRRETAILFLQKHEPGLRRSDFDEKGPQSMSVDPKAILSAMLDIEGRSFQSELTFLEGLLPNVNDPAIEARIESLKKQLNEK